MTTREPKPTQPLRANRPSQPPPAPSPIPEYPDRLRNGVDELRTKIARILTLARTTEEFAGNHNLRGDDPGDAESLEHLLEVTTEACEGALRGCDELGATVRGSALPATDLPPAPPPPVGEETRETNAVELDEGQIEP